MPNELYRFKELQRCSINDSSAKKAAVKYAVNAGSCLMDAAGYPLLNEIHHLSQVLLIEIGLRRLRQIQKAV